MKTGYALRNTIGITLFTATMLFSACDKEDSTQKPTEPVTSAKLITYNSKGYPTKATVKETETGQAPVTTELIYAYK